MSPKGVVGHFSSNARWIGLHKSSKVSVEVRVSIYSQILSKQVMFSHSVAYISYLLSAFMKAVYLNSPVDLLVLRWPAAIPYLQNSIVIFLTQGYLFIVLAIVFAKVIKHHQVSTLFQSISSSSSLQIFFFCSRYFKISLSFTS